MDFVQVTSVTDLIAHKSRRPAMGNGVAVCQGWKSDFLFVV